MTTTDPNADRDYDRLDELVDVDPIELRDTAWRLVRALDRADARIRAVQDVHWADKALSGHVCAEDGHDWPCPTIRALEAG